MLSYLSQRETNLQFKVHHRPPVMSVKPSATATVGGGGSSSSSTTESPPVAHKFGGSSVGTAARIADVAAILLSRSDVDGRQVVVVSAMQGVTDALIALCRKAAARDDSWVVDLLVLQTKHTDAAKALLTGHQDSLNGVIAKLTGEFTVLSELLRAQALIGSVSTDLIELIQGLGEVWSSTLLHAHLASKGAEGESVWLDARDVLVIEPGPLGAAVQWGPSRAKVQQFVATHGVSKARRVIVTGFIARTTEGRITTLGRNGSDYSGAIFASLFDASELHIWTDVDGVMSADPRQVPDAVLLARMSYEEACELAYFGANVVHPQTMAPAFARGIPIIIRNTFAPQKPGTRIGKETDTTVPVKGITTFGNLALLNLEGAGLLGVPGTAERTFGALARSGVSVVMISQGSSEHSICCLVQESVVERGQKALEDAFTRELAQGLVSGVTITRDIAALAVVGDGMAGTPGIAARLFTALGAAHINVRDIAQGSSERNISVAVAKADATRALRAVHAGFFGSSAASVLVVRIGVLGPGNVGQTFLNQLDAARGSLLRRKNLDLQLVGIAGSKKMLLFTPSAAGDINASSSSRYMDAKARIDREGTALDLAAFAAHVRQSNDANGCAIVVDCTASGGPAEWYQTWLTQGIHVITPNKQAGSGSLKRYEAILAATRAPFAGRFYYEATVGAGLPVMTTLRDMVDTGDVVMSVDGILSGTLSWLFNTWDGDVPFSALVRRAKEMGYTEPDPRDDLSGLDVARKLVILARETGSQMTLDAVQLESLVPSALRDIPTDEFLTRLPEMDGPMKATFEDAKRQGNVLRYVAQLKAVVDDATGAVESYRATVGLLALPKSHAFAHVKLTDNVLLFSTKRYRSNPLLVQGPGAGAEVTAAGVFGDLLRCCGRR